MFEWYILSYLDEWAILNLFAYQLNDTTPSPIAEELHMYLQVRLSSLDKHASFDKHTPRACTIKNYGFVLYGKWTDFIVS